MIKQEDFTYRFGGTDVKFVRYGQADAPIRIIHLHRDEDAAFYGAAYHLIRDDDLSLFAFEIPEKPKSSDRYLTATLDDVQLQFDPNRIFTEAGVNDTLKVVGAKTPVTGIHRSKTLAFGLWILEKCSLVGDRQRKDPIIAVHTNTNNGGLTIDKYIRSISRGVIEDAYKNSRQDKDEFFFVTEPDYFINLKALKLNAVLQKANAYKIDDDGSMSVWADNHKIPYINAESQDRHARRSRVMIAAALKILRAKFVV